MDAFRTEISGYLSGKKMIDYYLFFWLSLIIASAYVVADITGQLLVLQMGYSDGAIRLEIASPPTKSRKSLLDIIATNRKVDTTQTTQGSINPPFKLVGTVKGTGGGSSYGVFEDSRKREQLLVKLGDEVLEGFVLKDVYDDRVTLLKAGKEVSLSLRYEDKGGRKGVKTTPVPAVTGGSTSGAVLDKHEVDDALKNLNVVMTQARVIPYMVRGESKGYRVFAIRPGSIYTKIGLKNGDIIQRVNGVELNDPEKAYYLFQQLRNEPKVTIDVIRRGKKISIPVEVR